jgi:hypothetical protein
MTTIHLKPDLAERIAHLAEGGNAEVVVEKALRAYIAQHRREKIRGETEAFERQHEKLLSQFPGQYVAVHEGQVIDHDSNLRTLHLRVFDSLRHTPVLLIKVTPKPDRELVFRSPRFERHMS